MTFVKSHMMNSGKALALAAAFSVFGAAVLPAPASAQAQGQQAQTTGPQRVDSVLVVGNQRVAEGSIIAIFGVTPGSDVTGREIQRGIKQLFSSQQFADVRVSARGTDGITLVIDVEEQPSMRSVIITGLEHMSEREVRDTTDLVPSFPFNQQKILNAKQYIREGLQSEGIPFASIEERVEPVEGVNEVDVYIDVTEGQRVTIAQVDFVGNSGLPDDALAGAMSTRAEGFWWFRSGSYDESRYETDLEQALPALARSRGFLDFQVVSDTLVVDPESGKARAEITVDEGAQYRLGSFTVEGNTRFTDEELTRTFQRSEGGILRTLGLRGGEGSGVESGQVFDAEAFNEAIFQIREMYANEGYLYAQITPVLERVDSMPERPLVNATWRIQESTPAIVNRVSIVGNEYTYEWVVRDRVVMLPGDVYSQNRVLRSYQAISGLGFFETPMPPPDIQPLENGDVDITFNVVEKQTGSINFGTSVGGGVGLSGFIGYQQPNLFGQAKSGNLRWDFGRYLNSFELSYSDPAMFQGRVSGTVSLFNSRDRFFQFQTGRRRRVGASTRFGIPWPGSRVTRVFAGYGISRTKYEQFDNVDDNSLFGRPPGVQSQLTLGLTRQTLDSPLFPTVGSRQSLNFEVNGGPLGGDGDFTRILGEGAWWTPVGTIGDATGGGRPIRFALGLTLRAGAVFGDAGAFPFDRFWMGGVQFGQQLRGYDETSITPLGYFGENSNDITDINRLGNAFFSLTAEYALRLNDQISLGAFYDAGNVFRDPGDFDPTRLFRGAGLGMQLVTPFGPIGLDYAYGFDRTNPGWQLHFRMGPGF